MYNDVNTICVSTFSENVTDSIREMGLFALT